MAAVQNFEVVGGKCRPEHAQKYMAKSYNY
jgi:hypothetical protein